MELKSHRSRFGVRLAKACDHRQATLSKLDRQLPTLAAVQLGRTFCAHDFRCIGDTEITFQPSATGLATGDLEDHCCEDPAGLDGSHGRGPVLLLAG